MLKTIHMVINSGILTWSICPFLSWHFSTKWSQIIHAVLYRESNIKALGEWWLWYRLSLVLILKPTFRVAYPCNLDGCIKTSCWSQSESVTVLFYLRYPKVANRLAFSSPCYCPFVVFVILILEAKSKVGCYLTVLWVCLLAFSNSFPCVIIYVTNNCWMPIS